MIRDVDLMRRIGFQPVEADINDFFEAGLENPEETIAEGAKEVGCDPGALSAAIRLGLELGRYEAQAAAEAFAASEESR